MSSTTKVLINPNGDGKAYITLRDGNIIMIDDFKEPQHPDLRWRGKGYDIQNGHLYEVHLHARQLAEVEEDYIVVDCILIDDDPGRARKCQG